MTDVAKLQALAAGHSVPLDTQLLRDLEIRLPFGVDIEDVPGPDQDPEAA